MKLFYENFETNFILDLLKQEVVKKNLVYMITYKQYQNLNVVPKPFHIEISNDEITVLFLLYVGFEMKEYAKYSNCSVVSFQKIFWEMHEFKDIEIKYINPIALFHTIISLEDNINLKSIDYLLKGAF